MATREEVERFLNRFFQKLKIFSIIFWDNREKNHSTLFALDISPRKRIEVIKSITVDDYSEGPIIDTLHDFGEIWVFGKDVKGQEVYIKITMGKENSSTICISFHIAEHPMKYPHKKKGE
mgnify:FL=1